MPRQPSMSLAHRVRRAISPTYGARANAAEALEALSEAEDAVVLHSSDVALFSGHPVGLSKRRAAGRLGTALWEVFPGAVALLDCDGVIVSVNRAWQEGGLSPAGSPTAGLGVNYLDLCRRSAAEGEPLARDAADLIAEALDGGDPGRRLSYEAEDGRCFSMQAVPIPGRQSGALVVYIDMTSERTRENEWQHRALHDPLTGLPNRALLLDRLNHAVAAAARDPHSLAVLFVDLVAFKSVNDRLGHDVGDKVLREVAIRMSGSLRTADTIGRWGGDEFLVVAERLDHGTTARDLADRITASLDEPLSIGGEEISLQATAGVAHLDHQQSAEELVQAADAALLRLRQGGVPSAR